MTQAPDQHRDLWWRFDRYEVRDGFIRPSARAALETYDPWNEFRSERERGLPRESAYASLFRLLDEIGYDEWKDDAYEERPDQTFIESLICDWCRRYGLLGLGLQWTQRITLAPRWSKKPNEGHFYQETKSYHRWYGAWREEVRRIGDLKSKNAKIGEIVPTTQRLDFFGSGRTSGTLSRAPGTVEWIESPLDHLWAWFFPDFREDPSVGDAAHYREIITQADEFDYPMPLTEKFWGLYAEEVSIFLAAAAELRNTALQLGKFTDGEIPIEEAQRQAVYLTYRLEGAYPIIVLSEANELRQAWTAPSLFGTFGLMVSQDLCQHERIMLCNVCSRSFVTKAYQANYCSDRCRHTAQKRRQRARKRQSH